MPALYRVTARAARNYVPLHIAARVVFSIYSLIDECKNLAPQNIPRRELAICAASACEFYKFFKANFKNDTASYAVSFIDMKNLAFTSCDLSNSLWTWLH